jgi:type I restriction enzyme S subunit
MIDYKLKELIEIKNGRDNKHLSKGNIPVYGSGGLMRYVNEALYKGESILLPRKGTLTNIQYVNESFWTIDTIYYSIVDKKKAEPYYIYYYLKLLDLSHLNSGTGVPSMTFGAYYDIPIRLPDLQTQKSIAKILSDLDAKIELNNKINAELEAMAKLIYDYWFVQFDFPDENRKPYKSSDGKMVYNEELKREIPEGWDIERLNSLLDHNSGYSFSSKSYCDSGNWKIVTIKSVQENGFDTSKCDRIKSIPQNLDTECNLEIGDLLMSLTGNTGRLCFVTESNCLLNQRVAKIWSYKSSNYFIYLYFKRPEKQKLIEQLSSGSSQANLSPLQLFKTKDLIPENSILKSFEDKIKPIFQKILVNEKENQKLAELRDWLLPVLMNGQVRVK